jgi:hypothetical protein
MGNKRVMQHLRGISRIEPWLRGGFAFFFAFLLPLLCWGSVADPHHAHPGAHFVFAEPPAAHRHWHPPGTASPAAPPASTTQAESPTGRATPVTLLAALLVLVLWALAETRRGPALHFARTMAGVGANSYQASAPTPPPRLLSRDLCAFF